jgi:MoaA/NifB/PqqE/SkfB family radical SAM enzyme
MPSFVANYCKNLLKLLHNDRLLNPLVVSFSPTAHCNFNCVYCEDYGARRNHQQENHLPLDQAIQVLSVIRTGADALIFTGGEPLLYPQIDSLLQHAKQKLQFRQLTLITNASFLHEHDESLQYLDRVIVSLDSTDAEDWQTIVGVTSSTVQTVYENLQRYAARQQALDFQMAVNCVLTAETLSHARKILEFCKLNRIAISFSPQAVQNWPHYDLLVAEAYTEFIQELILLKRRGEPILGSMAYLKTLLFLQPYSCYPTLAPRVMPNGDLVYPCRPIERQGGAHGGRPVNLLDVDSWNAAVQIAFAQYGQPPRVCSSCFQQCYAEPSLMQAQPLIHLVENIRFAPSRNFGLSTYAPG